MIYDWKKNDGSLLAQLSLDDASGIEIKIAPEIKLKHGREIEELQTLNLYPPLDESKVAGEITEDGMTTYRIKPSRKWELAKQDIVATFRFWLDGQTNLVEQ